MRVHGTEGRPGNYVPPQDVIHPFVVFRGSDILDLNFLDDAVAVAPSDPAVVSVGLAPNPACVITLDDLLCRLLLFLHLLLLSRNTFGTPHQPSNSLPWPRWRARRQRGRLSHPQNLPRKFLLLKTKAELSKATPVSSGASREGFLAFFRVWRIHCSFLILNFLTYPACCSSSTFS